MENMILAAVLILILGMAGWYVARSKKRGVKCIGCPHAGKCAAKNSGTGCSGNE